MATADLSGSGNVFGGSAMGNALTELLMCPEIQPGSAPSYQVCKTVYEYHAIGKKMVDAPVEMAQSQARDVVVSNAPERVVRAFLDEWRALRCDKHAANVARVARIYGLGSIAVIVEGDDPSQPLDREKLASAVIGFNVLDPLNTSGSISVLSQDPNSLAFQNTKDVRVAGVPYHNERTCVLMNEAPIYISYTGSAYGYVGRSVYQRALFPLKSFVQSMRTDDLVVRKAGVIVAKIQQTGSMVDNVMARIAGQKRALAKEAITDDVLSIGDKDAIESLNLMNLEGPYTLARRNIIENIAASAPMPAKILNSQTFAEGFGEGTEDAKDVARHIDSIREDMRPVYDFLDGIVQYRAWSPQFYETIRATHPDEYGGVSYEDAFFAWRSAFRAEWPSLLIEPESERVKVDDVRFRAAIAVVEVLKPDLDPDNKVKLIDWLATTCNSQELLFPQRLDLDLDALEAYVAEMAEQQRALAEAGAEAAAEKTEQEPGPPRPFSDAVANFRDAVARLPERTERKTNHG